LENANEYEPPCSFECRNRNARRRVAALLAVQSTASTRASHANAVTKAPDPVHLLLQRTAPVSTFKIGQPPAVSVCVCMGIKLRLLGISMQSPRPAFEQWRSIGAVTADGMPRLRPHARIRAKLGHLKSDEK
jgi:hypothetical protein